MNTTNPRGIFSKKQTDADIKDTLFYAEKLQEKVERLLSWGDLTDAERGELTQACNAAELAAACLRGRGPKKEVRIGF